MLGLGDHESNKEQTCLISISGDKDIVPRPEAGRERGSPTTPGTTGNNPKQHDVSGDRKTLPWQRFGTAPCSYSEQVFSKRSPNKCNAYFQLTSILAASRNTKILNSLAHRYYTSHPEW